MITDPERGNLESFMKSSKLKNCGTAYEFMLFIFRNWAQTLGIYSTFGEHEYEHCQRFGEDTFIPVLLPRLYLTFSEPDNIPYKYAKR